MSASKPLTHIAGTFVIEASASFLNGAGLGEGEDRNVSIVKTFRDGQYRVPYVSSQAWKRWLRNTMIEETGWKPSDLKALKTNVRGFTSKIGGEFNPIDFAEDDLFGYMRTELGTGKTKGVAEQQSGPESEEGGSNGINDAPKQLGKKVKALTRASPFSASILISLRKTGWKGEDEGFVHLKEGTPVPYTTEFYSTNLQGVFCLNYKRLGVFSNLGDRIELDESKIGNLLEDGKIRIKEEQQSGKVYEVTDAVTPTRKERASELIKALSRLRGGAKQAAFGTDVSPKVLILAGLSSGNPIFNSLFTDDGMGVRLKIDTLKEILTDYGDKICTPVYIGIRKEYLKNEGEVMGLSNTTINDSTNELHIVITTPIDAAIQMSKSIQ